MRSTWTLAALLLAACHQSTAVAPDRVAASRQAQRQDDAPPPQAPSPAQTNDGESPPAPPTQSAAPAAASDFLKLHNDARAAVGVAPLAWSDRLAASAQEWADQLARSNRFEHRPDNPYGQNLAGYNPPDGPAAGVGLWLKEKARYRGERMVGGNYQLFGHYTQMIWRKTQRVGFGAARMPDGMWVLVAEYEPGGNVEGEHPYQ